MNNEIKIWLESEGTYGEGLLLLAKYGRNPRKLTHLTRKSDPLVLRYALEKLSAILPKNEITTPAPPFHSEIPKPSERLKVIREGSVRYQDLPAPIQEVYRQTCDHYRKMRSMHEKLKLASTDQERAAIRTELLEVDQLHTAAWKAIDKWAADGSLPPVQDPVINSQSSPDTPPDPEGTPDAKAVNSARVGIGRDLKALDKNPEEPKRAGLISRLQTNVKVIQAAGCGFGSNAEILSSLGLI